MNDNVGGKWAQEPKPCPFCGGIPIIKGEYVHCVNEACTLFFVPIGIGNWNRRPEEDTLRAERNQARRNCLNEVELLANEQETAAAHEAKLTAHAVGLENRLAAAYDVIGDFLAIYTVDTPVTVGYISDAVEKAKAVIGEIKGE